VVTLASQQLALAWIEARRAKRAAARWKALAKRLWRAQLNRYNSAAIHVRKRAEERRDGVVVHVYSSRAGGMLLCGQMRLVDDSWVSDAEPRDFIFVSCQKCKAITEER
jgi:hypothetical protein